MNFTAKGDPHARYSIQLSEINRMLKNDPEQLMRFSDDYYQRQINKTAESTSKSGRRIVLLTGPSGSGKTTTANKLKEELALFGKTAHVISLDDFYRGKGKYPKLPDGRDNYESVMALDLELIRKTISNIIDRGYAEMPKFDFSTVEKIDNAYTLTVEENDVVIFEGIHALNPMIMPDHHGHEAYRIYVSPKCQVLDGYEEVISGKNLRLTRRMVRDYKYRNKLHQQTVAVWGNVLSGERENISPFANNSDSVIDTTHFYEYGLYSRYLELCEEIQGFEKEFEIIKSIKKKFDRFIPITLDVSKDAMIREFIGKDESNNGF